MPNLTKEEYYSAFEKDDSSVYIIAEEKNSHGSVYARSFLAEKKAQRDLEASLIRDEREERTLAIAEEALVISRQAKNNAMVATIFAVIAAICSPIIAVMFG